jgi:hypothetical protein
MENRAGLPDASKPETTKEHGAPGTHREGKHYAASAGETV